MTNELGERLNQLLNSRADFVYLRAIIRRDAASFAFTLVGCTITTLVAVFQFAVLTSFLRAGAVVPSLLSASAWITAPGISAFDFPYPISEDYSALLARCFPDSSFERVAFGFVPWTSPSGKRGNLAIVGVERQSMPPRTFVADRSDLKLLGLDGATTAAEIGKRSFTLHGLDSRLATFLGTPYVLMNYRDGAIALQLPVDQASYIAVRNRDADRSRIAQQVKCANDNFPELNVFEGKEFALKSAMFWMLKSGAGAAVVIGAVLAGLLYFILLVNGISRFCQRRHHDLVSILGMGSPAELIRRILLGVVCVFAVGSMAAALVLLPVVDFLTEVSLPWVDLKPEDLLFSLCILIAGIIIGFAAAQFEVSKLSIVDVFRV